MFKNLGFTLFECLLVLLIASIIFFIGLPNIKSMASKKSMNEMMNELTRLLQYSRAEATVYHQTLVLKPLLLRDNWAKGAVLLCNGEIIHVFHWMSQGARVTWHGFLSRDAILIHPNLHQLAMNGYFEVSKDGLNAEKMCVSRFGQVHFDCI